MVWRHVYPVYRADETVCPVLDDLKDAGRVWREAAAEQADLKTVISDLMASAYLQTSRGMLVMSPAVDLKPCGGRIAFGMMRNGVTDRRIAQRTPAP